ncbi:hypothetical protein FSP39_009794 [Pinctada imbricata]|uniref:Selenoprotein O n=1 Tax=Pinctada imbricata TaxID=66713 RepID=A0AA88XJS0_PINIB|nr:hypothetical protein FSP39_009794 [Pinctada imbricata]
MLGEYINRKGERWELQLKGSGLTPYSRRGDGRAVLRSSVREFLGSEAMYHLGIPTSRAAALVVSDDPVMRDQFYDGHPQVERGAVVLRLAQSWFRIGSIEILTKNREIGLLRRLVDFVIEHHFPEIDLFDEDRYLQLFSTIVRQTAEMIAKWQSVGFTHGVCNTDNYSLLSITIDYGPFGFLDEYNPDFIPNTSDDEGRYNYRKQPDIGLWNLDKLRIAMLPLLNQDQKKQMANILNGYESIYSKLYIETFLKKLGLKTVESDDDKFIGVLLIMMENTASDFTMTFREMSEIPLERIESLDFPSNTWALKILSKHEWFGKWIRIYRKRIAKEDIHVDDGTRQIAMSAVNPRYVLRNWMAQSAIRKAERNDFSEVRTLLRILETPHKYQEDAEEAGYSSPPPSWAKSLKVSCSS